MNQFVVIEKCIFQTVWFGPNFRCLKWNSTAVMNVLSARPLWCKSIILSRLFRLSLFASAEELLFGEARENALPFNYAKPVNFLLLVLVLCFFRLLCFFDLLSGAYRWFSQGWGGRKVFFSTFLVKISVEQGGGGGPTGIRGRLVPGNWKKFTFTSYIPSWMGTKRRSNSSSAF